MQFSSSTSLFRFITVLVLVLFFASSSLANDSRAATTVAKIGAGFSSRAGLLAEALNDLTKTSIRGGARTLEEIFIALKGTGSVLQDVVEAATRCNACISRTQTALRGLNKTLGLKGKEALEWISNTARKFSDGVTANVDDFMYKVLKSCVGYNSSARAVAQCEQLANWRKAGQPSNTIKTILNCGNSFTAATRVLTRTGLIAIASLSIGTDVLAFNETSNLQGYYPVTAVLKNVDSEFTNLTLEMNGRLETINTTPEHPFYLEQTVSSRPKPKGHEDLSQHWVGAGHLMVGDVIRRSSGLSGVVRGVESRVESREMFNLSVETAHTFFVGDGHWLVHNCDLLPDEELANLSIQFGAAVRESKNILPGGVSGVIQSAKTGKIYFGISGPRDILNDLPQFAGVPLTGELIERIHPDIRELYRRLGVRDCAGKLEATNALCAEAKALTRMLYDGNTLADLKDSVSVAVNITEGKGNYLDLQFACKNNCQPVLKELGIPYLVKGGKGVIRKGT
jgi:hypothetical protein